MEIKSVNLIHYEANPEVGDPEIYAFEVKTEEGEEITVPNDPRNRHYTDVAHWYSEQKTKPFEFDFESSTEAEPEG